MLKHETFREMMRVQKEIGNFVNEPVEQPKPKKNFCYGCGEELTLNDSYYCARCKGLR